MYVFNAVVTINTTLLPARNRYIVVGSCNVKSKIRIVCTDDVVRLRQSASKQRPARIDTPRFLLNQVTDFSVVISNNVVTLLHSIRQGRYIFVVNCYFNNRIFKSRTSIICKLRNLKVNSVQAVPMDSVNVAHS